MFGWSELIYIEQLDGEWIHGAQNLKQFKNHILKFPFFLKELHMYIGMLATSVFIFTMKIHL